MWSEWFPAMVHHPQTCLTFRLLELFHIVTLTGKLSAHEFYKSLEFLMDNTELEVPKVSYWYCLSVVVAHYVLDSLQIFHAHGAWISPPQVNETAWVGEHRGWPDINRSRRSCHRLSSLPYPGNQSPWKVAWRWHGMEVSTVHQLSLYRHWPLFMGSGFCMFWLSPWTRISGSKTWCVQTWKRIPAFTQDLPTFQTMRHTQNTFSSMWRRRM